ncbi:DUF1304 domain-containing protein [Microbacterium sediminicola]|uniref:DUF1304 domain-containing protein n=1 Tax=Microbacterium sediminicola TaxID=415210 RepID=A0ABP4UMH8_9MICO
MTLALVASVFALAAALVHVGIFLMESALWSNPRIWRIFGLRSQADADVVRPMAYNQGFYNLFLAFGASLGVVLFWAVSPVVGKTLVLFALGSMVAAALVLTATGRRYLRAALVQGTIPLVGLVLFAFA